GLKQDSKNNKELLENRGAAMDASIAAADAVITKFRQTPPEYVDDEPPLPPAEGVAPEQAYESAKNDVDLYLGMLKRLGLPKMFSGIKPFLIVPIICAIAAVLSNWITAGHPMDQAELQAFRWDPKVIALTVIATLAVCGLIAWLLYIMAKS